MNIHEEQKEILVLIKKFNLNEKLSGRLALILKQFFYSNFDQEDAVDEIIKYFKLTAEQARRLLAVAGWQYYQRLELVKMREIDKLIVQENIDVKTLQAELVDAESEIIFPAELPAAGVNEREEMLDVFKRFLKDSLKSQFDDNKEELNNRLVEYLLMEGRDFLIALEESVKSNRQLIGNQNIEIKGQVVPPTIANWLEDFIAFGLLKGGDNFDKINYFNRSKNFLSLNEADKGLIAKLLDLCWRLFCYPQSFSKLGLDEWYIIPYNFAGPRLKTAPAAPIDDEEDEEEDDETDEEDEEETTAIKKPAQTRFLPQPERLGWIKQRFEEILVKLEQQYSFQKNLVKYRPLNIRQLAEEIKRDAGNPVVVLPALLALGKQPNSLKAIKNLAGFNREQNALADCLKKAGLTENEAAVFIIYLAKFNAELAGFAYADLKTRGFKLA